MARTKSTGKKKEGYKCKAKLPRARHRRKKNEAALESLEKQLRSLARETIRVKAIRDKLMKAKREAIKAEKKYVASCYDDFGSSDSE